MGKNFRNTLASAGYATRRADNPAVLREMPQEGIGSGYGSDSPDSANGPSMRFMDELITVRPQPNSLRTPKNNDDVETRMKEEPFVNPYTKPSDSGVPETVLEATSNRRAEVPVDFENQLP
jgi:hypothetical protein